MGYQPGEGAPVVPLRLVMDVCATPEAIRENIAATLRRPYQGFMDLVESRKGEVAICGFGPSLVNTCERIKQDVIACNGAHDYLISRGIVPTFGMFFDADRVIADFITPHPDVCYLIASRCHPAVFEKLRGYKVVVWHCKGDACIDEMLGEAELMEPMVHGGSAGVTRAMFVGHAMGYRTFHIHGADSSYDGETTHVKKSLVEEELLSVWVKTDDGNGLWFKTTPQLAAQVEDWKTLAPQLDQIGARFVVHGHGLLPHIAGVLGYTVVGDQPQTLEEQHDGNGGIRPE